MNSDNIFLIHSEVSQNIQFYSPHRRDWNFEGVGVSVRPKTIKEYVKLNWYLPKGERSLKKSLPWGRYGNFLELHILLLIFVYMYMYTQHPVFWVTDQRHS